MLFHEKLLFCRRSLGLTQTEVARKVNVVRSTYTRYERGDTEPNLLTVLRLARLFGVTADWLIDPDGEPTDWEEDA